MSGDFMMVLLRVYLLAGLLVHKAVWELMKKRGGGRRPARPQASLRMKLVKTVKIGILAGILLQTLLPDIFPLSSGSTPIRSVGALIYTVGLVVALLGRTQLGQNWSDIESPGVKKTQAVVSAGLYRYIRHPIYVGDLLLLVGLELALNSWLVFLAAFLVPLVLHRAVREERLLIQTLPGYGLYCRQTKRFIPFLA